MSRRSGRGKNSPPPAHADARVDPLIAEMMRNKFAAADQAVKMLTASGLKFVLCVGVGGNQWQTAIGRCTPIDQAQVACGILQGSLQAVARQQAEAAKASQEDDGDGAVQPQAEESKIIV